MSTLKRNHPGAQLRVERPFVPSLARPVRFSMAPAHGRASWLVRLLLGLALSSGISLLAYRRKSLTKGGAAGAVATGTTIFGLGGWPHGLALI